MGLSQTPVQDQKAVHVGSASLLYSTDNGSSFTNLGVGDGFAFTEEITPLDAEPDNGVAPERADGVANQTVTLTGNLWEYSLSKINAIRGGIDLIATVAGTPVAGATQVQASGEWAYEVPWEIEGQNASGLVPTINSLTGSVDGAIVDPTDYVLIKDASTNKWSVVISDSVTVTTLAQTMTLDYDYTPASSTSVSSGGLTSVSRRWYRMINITAAKADSVVAAELGISVGDIYHDTLQYDFYYGIINSGESVTVPSKDDTNPVIKYVLSVGFENKPDRTAGDQLFKRTQFNQLAS